MKTLTRELWMQYLGEDTWVNLIDIDLLVGEQGSAGIDGKEVTFRVDSGFIQWQYLGGDSWTNLIEISSLIGPAGADGISGVDGEQVMMQVNDSHIQWKYESDSVWTDLIAIELLIGPAGADGINGVDGKEIVLQVAGGFIQWKYKNDFTWGNESEVIEYLEYTIENNEVTINSYSGTFEDIYLPYAIEGYPVTKIANYAFIGSTMKTIYIPTSITHIGVSRTKAIFFPQGENSANCCFPFFERGISFFSLMS